MNCLRVAYSSPLSSALVNWEKGIRKADNPAKERAKVELLLKNIAVILPDEETAGTYGKICRDLEGKGLPIPDNDAWIAATALEGSMKLATGDAHFERVNGLDVLLLAT